MAYEEKRTHRQKAYKKVLDIILTVLILIPLSFQQRFISRWNLQINFGLFQKISLEISKKFNSKRGEKHGQ